MTACGRTVTTDIKTGMVLVKGIRLALGWEMSLPQGQEIDCHGREWGILGLWSSGQEWKG